MLFLNRDNNATTNIGTMLKNDKSPVATVRSASFRGKDKACIEYKMEYLLRF